MSKHPNAAAGAGLPGAVAAVIYIVSLFGVSLPDPPVEAGIAIGAALSGLILLLGRSGLRGIARVVWRGNS